MLTAREEHRAALGAVLERLAAAAQDRGAASEAVAWTRRQAALDPLAEEPLRRLMQRLANAGDRSSALAAYERFGERLRRELRLVPDAETRELATALRAAPAVAPRPLPGYESVLPLVGRERDLDTLLAAWRATRAGSGAVVTISGEPGFGKTRLALELLERARGEGALVATGAALDLGGGAPLALWAEALGDLSRDLDTPPLDATWPTVLAPLVPDLEHQLGRPPAPRSGAAPDLERARLFEASVALLAWASRRPLVVLLEDVHAADPASLELTGHVARRTAGLPVLLVLTRRPRPRRAEVDALEHALRARGRLACELALGPLPAGDVAHLVELVASLPQSQVAQIVAASDGNALLAVERARALARGEEEAPASLRGAVRAALSPLGEDALWLAHRRVRPRARRRPGRAGAGAGPGARRAGRPDRHRHRLTGVRDRAVLPRHHHHASAARGGLEDPLRSRPLP